MVLGFARQSGGDVRIESEVGRGTRVSLFLPRANDSLVAAHTSALSPPPVARAEAAGNGQLALLVEDHDEVRQTVRRQLLELGYQVLEARDADDARALLAAVPDVAVLVSDIIMPRRTNEGDDVAQRPPNGVAERKEPANGIGLADHARRLVPGIRIVLMSGFGHWPASGYDWFDERAVLRKPFGKEELTRALSASS
jgi:CheY-like chemotaxis protein